MGKKFLIIIITLLWSLHAFSELESLELSPLDSKFFFQIFEPIAVVTSKNNYKISFSSSNGAFKFDCSAEKINDNVEAANCVALFDKSFNKPDDSTVIRRGKLSTSLVAVFNDKIDNEVLSLIRQGRYTGFGTSEKSYITTRRSIVPISKFIINCDLGDLPGNIGQPLNLTSEQLTLENSDNKEGALSCWAMRNNNYPKIN